MHPTSITSLEIVLTKAPHQHQHHKTSLSLNFPPWRKPAISHIVHCLLQIWFFLMALKSAFIWVCAKIPHSHLGVPNFEARRYGVASELKLHKREFCCLALVAKQPLTPLDDEKPYGSGLASSDAVNRALGIKSLVLQKDLSLLPKPLSVNELLSSPDDGTKVRVAYQGIAGAYSEAAALKAYPDCETVPCDQFESAFKAVELWLVDKAVLPIENSLGGSIHRNYDLLLRHRLHIVREVQMAVNHCLLGLPGVRKDELKCVLSHPQALAQCEMTLGKLGLVRVNADDSAGAAQMVALSGKRDTGAIASSRAAEIYGLDILAEKIQDCNENITRFLILAREPIIPGIKRHYKTSIVFSLEEGPGMLFKALAVFAMRDISLSKIESRPQQKRPLRVVDDSSKGSPKYFDYLFYIDFEASMAEPRAQYALGHLQEFSTFLRILGCYPMDTGI